MFESLSIPVLMYLVFNLFIIFLEETLKCVFYLFNIFNIQGMNLHDWVKACSFQFNCTSTCINRFKTQGGEKKKKEYKTILFWGLVAHLHIGLAE